MSQNIYDNPEFLNQYRMLPRQQGGLEAAPEWDATRTVLPDLQCAHVLDLGCGFGWFSRWAADQGAARVVGIDVSTQMIAEAESTTPDSRISYVIDDLETFVGTIGSFDLVYSSLTFHYIEDLPRLIDAIRSSMHPGAKVVFTVEHPILSASRAQEFVELEGRTVWPIEGYLDEGERTTTWFIEGVVKHHRTVASYVNALADTGFRLDHLIEWSPSAGQIADNPSWAKDRNRPYFLIVSATLVDD